MPTRITAAARWIPIDEILKVANWSSRTTYERFYTIEMKVLTIMQELYSNQSTVAGMLVL